MQLVVAAVVAVAGVDAFAATEKGNVVINDTAAMN